MKSFVAYPLEFENLLYPQMSGKSISTGKVVAHYELYKKVKNLDGAIVKCGVNQQEGFMRFSSLKGYAAIPVKQKMIAFEKKLLTEYTAAVYNNLNIDQAGVTLNNPEKILKQEAIIENVDFVPGEISDAIPNYLIQHPELKISLLNIDLDHYDSTLTTLEFLFPRIIEGGILIMDNYYKNGEEFNAVNEYFSNTKEMISNFSVNKGPHYIIRH